MSALTASEKVLLEAGKPLSCREISDIALAKGYWETSGKTPWATIAAQIYTDINQHGDASRFIKAGPDSFALNPNPVATSIPQSKPAKHPKAKITKKDGKTLSFTQAAEKILATHGKKEPMHYRAHEVLPNRHSNLEIGRHRSDLGRMSSKNQPSLGKGFKTRIPQKVGWMTHQCAHQFQGQPTGGEGGIAFGHAGLRFAGL